MTGNLITQSFAEHRMAAMFAGQLGETSRDGAGRALTSWWRCHGARLGPASGLSALWDAGASPVLGILGLRARAPRLLDRDRALFAEAEASDVTLPVVVTFWGEPMDRLWPDVARHGLRFGSAWALCFNGRSLRLCDARRIYARDFAEFDLEIVAGSPASLALLWALLRAEAIPVLTSRIVAESAKHGVKVCASLRHGVRDALGLLLQALVAADSRRRREPPAGPAMSSVFEQALTVIYRILFLLFAEARGLVPVWHPVYRESYTVEALRAQAERPAAARGIWEALQALSRLSHAGCRAGSLQVTPFNGRLFSPARAPLAETGRLDDDLVAQALVALTTRPGTRGRERISFRDLGVEQLGAVYESVLDYEPSVEAASPQPAPRPRARRVPWRVRLVGQRDLRKASGTFYTPQGMTDYLVRQTLEPLVARASADDILALRVVDPAMGSGAFLVAACRYLASAYERALVQERGSLAADISESDRAGFRRLVARRCLYGVDLNPMAVQVARLSMWLTTLSADRPLTFLDHHLVVGDSLVGASLDDLARQPPGGVRPGRAMAPLPLFDTDEAGPALKHTLPIRDRIAFEPDDTADAVRQKERLLASLDGASAPLHPWKRAADLWCACWFWSDEHHPEPDAREFIELLNATLGRKSVLPDRFVSERLQHAREIAAGRRFFHWTLEFPEVFFDHLGRPLPQGGFDAMLGNPPWEMLRADSGPERRREARRASAHRLTRFAREAGVYHYCSDGHVNEYQLFLERSLRLARRRGRIGLVLPWGLASDHGSASLRHALFERCDTDRLVGFENARGIFPVHRGVRFILLSTTPGSTTRHVRCRFGERDPAVLEAIGGGSPPAGHGDDVVLTPALLERVSGSGLAVPHVRHQRDLDLLDRLSRMFPPLADPAGWGAKFGRELNATDDRGLFTSRRGPVPVVDGKHIDPFVVRTSACDRFVADRKLLSSTRHGEGLSRSRLGYRDVAASTNRLTLIAAIVPRDAITVHTVYCLKTRLALREQAFLCGMLNSFVANFLVRLWVTTHLGTTTVERLPMPRPAPGTQALVEISRLARKLAGDDRCWPAAYPEIQARAALVYGLSREELELVLDTFPLVKPGTKSAVVASFGRLAQGRFRV